MNLQRVGGPQNPFGSQNFTAILALIRNIIKLQVSSLGGIKDIAVYPSHELSQPIAIMINVLLFQEATGILG